MSAEMKRMECFWMPFTGYRVFKYNPRLVQRAEGMSCY
jgi:hypothetical protein